MIQQAHTTARSTLRSANQNSKGASEAPLPKGGAASCAGVAPATKAESQRNSAVASPPACATAPAWSSRHSSPCKAQDSLAEASGQDGKVFWTAGYEQTTPDRFMDLLTQNGVEVVVDVRKTPLSRKKGFSKNQLQDALSKGGIAYVHVEALGAPKEIRDRLHNGGTWREYVQAYEKMLESRRAELLDLVELAFSQRVCLLCFERDPSACHRSLVAREMTRLGNGRHLQVCHIQV